MSAFKSPREFREVMDRALELMSTDPQVGPKLKDARTPHRFDFPDIGAVVNVTFSDGDDYEKCLKWEWREEVDWRPDIELTMDTDVANRFFQGKENIAIALARRRVKLKGNLKKALALVPIIRPVFAQYRKLIKTEYPHLLA